jgi:manganese/iron transport system substrate-binding protein
MSYVDTIRDGLIEVDPAGEEIYAANAEAYKAELMELDAYIEELVAAIPTENRLLVTDHDSLGYFADRYGFRVVGAVIPSVTTGASPSARELAQLTDTIQETGARAIFSDVASNTQIAEQLAADVGIPFVSLYTHSLTEPDGDAPTYIEMMRYNARAIVAALE